MKLRLVIVRVLLWGCRLLGRWAAKVLPRIEWYVDANRLHPQFRAEPEPEAGILSAFNLKEIAPPTEQIRGLCLAVDLTGLTSAIHQAVIPSFARPHIPAELFGVPGSEFFDTEYEGEG